MPTPRKGEGESEFVERCIPIVIREGTAQNGEQAAAICHSMYRQYRKRQRSKKEGFFSRLLIPSSEEDD